MIRRPPLWPGPDHDRLLRAALLPRAEALAELERWLAGRELDAIDAASTRLLPLVARNLEGSLPAGDPVVARVSSIARAAWLKTQSVVARARPALAALVAEGVTPLLLKGWALAPYYGGDSRLRPMDDLDFAVPSAARQRAWRLLETHGFRPFEELSSDHGILEHRTGWNFSGGGAADVDLHWHVLACAPRDAIDEAIRRDARPAEVGGVACLALAPPDALLACVVHAARWEPIPAVRWAADATLLLRAEGECFDWEALLARARAAHAEPALRVALAYLKERLGVAIPGGTRARLGRGPLWRRVELAAQLVPAPEHSRLERLAIAAGATLRRTAPEGARLGGLAALRALLARRAASRRGTPIAELPSDGLALGVAANDEPFLGGGWSWPEPGGRWTIGRAARLRFRTGAAIQAAGGLEIELVPFLAPGASERELLVDWDGERVGSFRWEGSELHRRRIEP